MKQQHLRFFGGVIFFCSSFGLKSWADFKPEIPKSIHPVLKAQLEVGGQAWLSSEFPLSQPRGTITKADFRRLWEGLGNAALRYRLQGKAEDFTACRKSLMALASYGQWYALENDLLGTEAVWPVVVAIYARGWLGNDLPQTERELLRARFHRQLLRYEALVDGKTQVPWWGISNHPDLLPHLVAMALLAKDEEGYDDRRARKMLDEVSRQYRRYVNLADQQSDGADPFGVSHGLVVDWSRLILGPLLGSLYKEDDQTDVWARRRLAWYDAIILPGQNQLWSDEGVGSELRCAELLPVLWGLASRTKNGQTQHFALEMDRKSKSWSPWLFLSILWGSPEIKEDIDHRYNFQVFPSQGWAFGRENRRLEAAHFSFHVGNPAGETWHKAWLLGRPDLDFSHLQPDQGSWTWRVQNRTLLGVALHREFPATRHYNTLTVGDMGQLFEGYPRYLQDELKISKLGGELLVNERYGNSWLLLGEFSKSYSPKAELEKFYRAILWLSPTIMIQLDHVVCKNPKALSFTYNSPDYPLSPRGGGFYQKVSGYQFRSGSFPQGEWTIDYQRDEQDKDVAKAKESVVSALWDRCCLMTPASIQQDAWIEYLQSGIHLDFYQGQYKLEYSFKDAMFNLKMQVGEKSFFEVSKKLNE